ncbi:RNA polymerase sigma-I factor [Calderihabitans maritimus]|uniref:RNA polymerase sigma factor SigI n=1 Tax=Calderihabitans maritimus TaxID=1246530 RepID=A0A1Z5HQS4_9FIRM|nr:RNA polymerase sigma-I factor [Calderihabitans maritimus]GAW91883.1 putative RNA polymerase sigma factor SigI [Calderihabitans maritimus]
MQKNRLEELVSLAQSGNETAREELICSYRSFIEEVAAGYCGRRLEWENDDELSIALLAFNEAIDSYDQSFGKEFGNFARIVIKSRLADYFRKEARHCHLPLEVSTEDGETDRQWEVDAAWKNYLDRQVELDRADEMARFEQILNKFGLSLMKLEQSCPKHRDTRDKLVEIAEFITNHQEFVDYINRYKRLPLKELSLATGTSKKVLKRGRQYILAVFLILNNKEFNYLRSLFSLPSKKTTKYKESPEMSGTAKGGGQVE